MKILIVCSGNAPNFSFQKHQAFIYDQVEAIKATSDNIEFDYFFVKGKGLRGYLSNIKLLRRKVKTGSYSLIHAHVATTAFIANCQQKVPVVTTFHGSDINIKKLNYLSGIVAIVSRKVIFVSSKLASKICIKTPRKRSVIPCGVDFNLFKPTYVNKNSFGLGGDKKYVLFPSKFNVTVKNYNLVQSALNILSNNSIEVLELKNKTREEVNELMNACDMLLLTSYSEGSPQAIKEAMACNLPIVSTNVGDVREVLADTPGTYITTFKPEDVAEKINLALSFGKRTNGREKIKHLDNRLIAQKIIDVYDNASQ